MSQDAIEQSGISPEQWAKDPAFSGMDSCRFPLPTGWRFYLMFFFQPYRLASWFAEAIHATPPSFWSFAVLRWGPLNSYALEMKPLRRLFWRLLCLATLPLIFLAIAFWIHTQNSAPAPLVIYATMGAFLLFALTGISRNTWIFFIPFVLLSFVVQWKLFRHSAWFLWDLAPAFGVWVAFNVAGLIAATKLSAFRAVECSLAVTTGGAMAVLFRLLPQHESLWWTIGCFVMGALAGSANMVCQHEQNRNPNMWWRAIRGGLLFWLGAFSLEPFVWGMPPSGEWLSTLSYSFMLGSSRLIETLAVNVVQFVLYWLNQNHGVATLRFSPILYHDAHARTQSLSRHICLAPPNDPIVERVMRACYISPAERFIWVLTMRRIAPDVFISYNTKDRELVQKLVHTLQAAGVKVWFDATALRFGDPGWESRLTEGMFFTSAVVICLGPSGFGPWQRKEYDITLTSRKEGYTLPVIPLILPNAVAPPKEFESFDSHDLRRSDPTNPSLFLETARKIAAVAVEHRPKAL